MPEPVVDDGNQDETVTTASGKKVVLPPPPGQSSDLYNAEPADSKGNDSPYTTDFLKRFDPSRTDALTHSLADIERQRGKAEESQFGSLNRKMAADQAQMRKAFSAESASADTVPPAWNADKEQRERVRTPIEDFGSLGAVFGILASQFTKTPLTSAMNAAAAAMNATREHDEEGYKTAYQAWKDNTQLALKRFGMERELFTDANKLSDTDLQQWKVKQLQIAAQFDNKKAVAMLDAGMNGELIDLQSKQVEIADKIQKTMNDQETTDLRRSIFSAEVKNWDKEHPEANPYQRAKARLEILQGIATGGRNIQEDLLRQFRLDHPKATAQDEAQFLAQNPVGRGAGAPTKEKEVARRLAAWVEERKASGQAPTDDEIDAKDDALRQEVATASAAPKSITTPEQKTLTAAPVLMKHLATLDAFASATGTISGLVQRLGAEYGGVNDPAIIWQTAKRQAEAAVAELASGGRISVVGLKAQLEQLPDDYKAARFGKYQVQQFMQDLRDKAQSELDIIQAEGKTIPPEVLDKFAAIGVYPQSEAAKDPLLQLRKDPTKVTDDALIGMSRYMSSLPLADQQAIIKEAKRRKAIETHIQNSPN